MGSWAYQGVYEIVCRESGYNGLNEAQSINLYPIYFDANFTILPIFFLNENKIYLPPRIPWVSPRKLTSFTL